MLSAGILRRSAAVLLLLETSENKGLIAKDIACALNMPKNAVSMIASQLKKDGDVETLLPFRDQRQVATYLTRNGRSKAMSMLGMLIDFA